MRKKLALSLLALTIALTAVLALPSFSLGTLSLQFMRSEACQDASHRPCP